ANVIYSVWLDVIYDPLKDTTAGPNFGDTIGWAGQITADKLSAEILNTGEVKVYINFNTAANPVVVPIPYFDGGVIINPLFVTGGILLSSNTGNASSFVDGSDKIQQYRYILIPGGVNTLATPDVDWNDYNSVKKYLNLKD
ncbi:MAG: hypothetical protein ABI687_09765, partial [Flavitalea sp.]